MRVSIVVLTFNRRERLARQMRSLSGIGADLAEIIVVDNCSDERVDDLVPADGRTTLIRNEVNEGAVGRNRGMAAARGEIVVTLDDDVYGLTERHLETLMALMAEEDIAAINFKVIDERSGRICDWCHPCPQEVYGDTRLATNDISEGAVAFRKKALDEVGLYPDYFFISHEGPDLAFRLINAGWRVVYSPEIVVTHGYEQRARTSWRRYYFDTRNQLWFVLRNLSFWYGLKRLIVGWGGMLVYAVRDGHLWYWVKAVVDAVRGAPRAYRDRIPPTARARHQWREIEKNKPGFWHMAMKRIFSREVRI